MGRKGLFDLEKHFAFYGAYHSNPVNILIHTVFVWPIFFTSLVLLYFTPTICELFSLQPQCYLARHGLFLNLGFFFALLYAVFYVCMDRKAGSLAAALCMACWVGSSLLARHLGFSLAWKVVLAAQLFCWIGQFLGHGIFEKRAPALLDNLVQALLMAPFFVLFEVLQIVFGYEPYPGFHASVTKRIDAEIADWKEKKQKKMS
ncbi:hypothetical protein ACJRO7_009702 [Eucalyptus globulus]|uniref:Uncharacterized protein n=1 Tax=Eucalyptus globulus TaxID=34317 RepID=A0ABD3L9L0_EUCGL